MPPTKHRERRTVPIAVERLWTAWRASRHDTWESLAQAIGVTHAALSKILSGHTTRPRRVTVKALAQALNVVPVEWLTGETDWLAYVGPWRGSYDLTGGGMRPFTQGLPPPEDPAWKRQPGWDPAVQFALNGFLARCDKAAAHDFPKEEDRKAVMRSLLSLVESSEWRLVVLAPISPMDRRTDAVVALCQAFTTILEPWFEGKRLLSVRGLGGIARVFGRPKEADHLETLAPYRVKVARHPRKKRR